MKEEQLENNTAQKLLDCPVRLAEKFLRTCSKETLDSSCTMIGFRNDNPTVLDWSAYYLSKSCQCLKNTANTTDNTILTCIANVFMTLELDITAFENYVLYFGEFNHGSCPEKIDKIWAKAKEMPMGSTCLLCCGKHIDSKQGGGGTVVQVEFRYI